MPEDHFVDRSEMTDRLNAHLRIDPARTALVAIDLMRGHLDPGCATLPLPADTAAEVVRANARLFGRWRAAGLPLVHATQVVRRDPAPGAEVLSNPFWAAVAEVGETLSPGMATNLREHNLEGSPQAEVMPELAPQPGDHVVIKKRLTAFYATDLELLLRSLDVETVVITGVNTNTCVTGTAFEAMHRDFQVVVVSDCVASGHGDDLHRFGLRNIARCVGWVLTTDELADKAGLPSEVTA